MAKAKEKGVPKKQHIRTLKEVQDDLMAIPGYDPVKYAQRFLPERQQKLDKENDEMAAKGIPRW